MKNKNEQDLSLLLGEEIQELLKSHLYSKKPLFGNDSPFSVLLQSMVNTILDGEMEVFLSEERQSGKTNKRNGRTEKQLRSIAGPLTISTPRDRNAEFEPLLVGKRQRELSSGLDEQIIALYAQGNSVEDVRRLLQRMYGVEIAAGKISQITDKVLPELQEWRSRPLKAFYPVVYLDAVYFKVRHDGVYQSRAFYTVYGVDWEGQRDLLGIYIQGSEGASRWAVVLQDLHSRGVRDILVACVDDMQGFSEAITDHFPATTVQKCIVHQVRSSLRYVDDKDKKKVSAALRKVYTSPTVEQAASELEAFSAIWGSKYSFVAEQWASKWGELMAFMDFPLPMRKMIYTTNPVEAVHRIIRKLIKGKAAWPSETALAKQIYLSLKHNEKSWKKNAYGWKSIQRDLLELYADRIKAAVAAMP